MRLLFIRHGEPDYVNDCLTENGKQQAKSTSERLKREPITGIFSSPMGRAKETASYTAKSLHLPVKTLEFMHEIDWGGISGELEFEGHPWTLAYKLLAENPEYVGSDKWDQHHFFKDNKCLECYRYVAEEFDDFLLEFGLKRHNGLYRCETMCDDTIALFAHGGSGAIMFSHVLNLPFPFVLTSMPYGVCSVSGIAFSAEADGMVIPRLEFFNDMAHVENVKHEALHFEK